MQRPTRPQDYWPAEIWEAESPGELLRARREAKKAFYASEEVGQILEQTRPPQYLLGVVGQLTILASVVVTAACTVGVMFSAGFLVVFFIPFAMLFVKLVAISVIWLSGSGTLGLTQGGRKENPEFREWQSRTEEIVGEFLTPEQAKQFEAILPHKAKEEHA